MIKRIRFEVISLLGFRNWEQNKHRGGNDAHLLQATFLKSVWKSKSTWERDFVWWLSNSINFGRCSSSNSFWVSDDDFFFNTLYVMNVFLSFLIM